jgi:phosphate:Na+ symporter
VANAQILFNLIGVAAVILFLPAIARGLEWLIPDVAERQLYPSTLQAPEPI